MFEIYKKSFSIALIIFCFLSLPVPPLSGQEEVRKVRIPRDHFMPQFRDTEIKDFLKTMAAITRRNILIDDKIRGKVSLVWYKPIPVSRAMEFLKHVLEAYGYDIIEQRNLIRVVKAQEAGEVSMPAKKDPGKGASGVLTRVVHLEEGADAQKLMALLRPLIGKETTIVAYAPTNKLVITGYAANLRRAISIIDQLGVEDTSLEKDVKEPIDGNVHIYRVRNMEAESLAKVLIRLDNPQVEEKKQPTQTTKVRRRTPIQRAPARPEKIKAVAHKESNSLVVTAGPAEWREIKQIIKSLDRKRSQILLEVLIAEISASRLNDFGIDWRYQGRAGPHTQFNTGMAVQGNLISEKGVPSGINTLSGFSLGFIDKGGELMAILNANISKQNFNVLSAPQILTLDNQEAEIKVGQDVPVKTASRTTGGGTSEATIDSFDYRPSGIRLKFTPHVNPEQVISLDIDQEVTNIEGANSPTGNPTFNKRNIKTFVTVKNKQTIVIGGLINSEKQHSVTMIPLLGDIPLIGFIFRRTTYSTKKTNLMIFITPHILDRPEEADRVTEYKRAEQSDSARRRSNELKLWPEKKVPPKNKVD